MSSESGLSARYALSFLRRAFPVYRRMRWRRASALAYRFALAMFTSGSGKGDCRQVIRKSLRIRERSNSERRNRKMFLAVRGSISAAVMIPGRRNPRCTPYIGGISVAVKMFCDAFLRKIAGIGYLAARRNPLLRKYVGHAELQDLRGKTNNPRYEREGAGIKHMRPFCDRRRKACKESFGQPIACGKPMQAVMRGRTAFYPPEILWSVRRLHL